jgi:hypothetical protein
MRRAARVAAHVHPKSLQRARPRYEFHARTATAWHADTAEPLPFRRVAAG